MGATIKEQFSDSLFFDKFGVITGSASIVQFPNEPCGMARFKADNGNIGLFLIGEDGSATTPFPLYGGDDTGWISTSNLNRYQHSDVSGTADYLYYWLQR